ncbi:beta-1,4-galactosyltransferase 4-like [Homarus americanus]|uniref:beta-1,4-galactosyltransferase 4-like n=1 Tax=Homarus americanus TaxID=6706 RepID=UPI001C4565E4|nr:beta-1,4-galactosyltransferase 4-like [Homarus americanus]
MMADREKFEKYEHFVNNVLREDLRSVLEDRDKLFEEIAAHSQLKQTIDCMTEAPSEEGLRTQVDLGSNFYVQAHVQDVSRMYVNVGLGFHVELALQEASTFIDKKLGILNARLSESTKKSTKIKAQIKFVCQAIGELHQMNDIIQTPKMTVPVRVRQINYKKIWFVSISINFIVWLQPLITGKYTDATFTYIPASNIVPELVGLVGPKENGDLPWCPVLSPHLQASVTLLNNNVEPLSDEEILRKYDIQAGGVWKPKDCQSRYNVALLIPYRNRSRHLQQFLTYMHPFLSRQQLNYRIVVVEQTADVAFNRAKLFNIGFKETLFKLDQVDCFIFHDVDLLPQNDYNTYACTHYPRHMSTAVDTFRYHLPYRNLFGGAVAMQKLHFTKVNGFSNRYYGWGAEDDDMYNRIKQVGLTIVRFDPRVATYVMLSHVTLPPAEDRYEKLRHTIDVSEDGLSNLSYRVVKNDTKPLYTWILVSC